MHITCNFKKQEYRGDFYDWFKQDGISISSRVLNQADLSLRQFIVRIVETTIFRDSAVVKDVVATSSEEVRKDLEHKISSLQTSLKAIPLEDKERREICQNGIQKLRDNIVILELWREIFKLHADCEVEVVIW